MVVIMMKTKQFSGTLLKELRINNGLEYADLLLDMYAKVGIKVTRATFFNWESGRSVPDANRLKKLSDYFGVKIDYFFI